MRRIADNICPKRINSGVLAEGIARSFPIWTARSEIPMLIVIIAGLATLLVGGITLTAYLWYLTPNPRDRI